MTSNNGWSPSVAEVEKDVSCAARLFSLILMTRKRLYNLRQQDAFRDISSFQKFAKTHCIVLSYHGGSEEIIVKT